MDPAQVFPLGNSIARQCIRQFGKGSRHFAHTEALTRNHLAAFANDQGEPAGIDQPSAKANCLTFLGLRAIGQRDRANVDGLHH